MRIAITRDMQLDLYRWNAANERSRNEYDAHPTAACQRMDRALRNGQPEHPCDALAATDDIYCRRHRTEVNRRNKAARERRRR